MTKFQVTMVNPQQIAQKGLKGCKTTRQVTTFAQKHNVPWTWYKPTPNYRVMLVDWPGFRTAWKENATFGDQGPDHGDLREGRAGPKTTAYPKNNYATTRDAPRRRPRTRRPITSR